MFMGIQLAVVVVGVGIMARGRFAVGNREIANPMASLIGIILIVQLPIALLVSIALAIVDGPGPELQIPTRAGEPVAVPKSATVRAAENNWWVDPLVTCGSILVAAGVTAIGLRTEDENQHVLAKLAQPK